MTFYANVSPGIRENYKEDNKNRIDEDQIEELKEAFQLFDTEHQGKIDHREFKAALRALGYEITRDDVEK